MNLDRFFDLLDVLEDVAERDLPFDLRTWAGRNSAYVCGTTACAVGYYALLSPEAAKVKFGLYNGNKRVESIEELNVVIASNKHLSGLPIRAGKQRPGCYDSWDAVAQHFGISVTTAMWLFSDSTYSINRNSIDHVIIRVCDAMLVELKKQKEPAACS